MARLLAVRLKNKTYSRRHLRLNQGRRTNTKKLMKYDWINISLENKGIVRVSLLPQGLVASMTWPGIDPVSCEPQTTLPDALTALNAALEDDAAEEVCPSNVEPSQTA